MYDADIFKELYFMYKNRVLKFLKYIDKFRIYLHFQKRSRKIEINVSHDKQSFAVEWYLQSGLLKKVAIHLVMKYRNKLMPCLQRIPDLLKRGVEIALVNLRNKIGATNPVGHFRTLL